MIQARINILPVYRNVRSSRARRPMAPRQAGELVVAGQLR